MSLIIVKESSIFSWLVLLTVKLSLQFLVLMVGKCSNPLIRNFSALVTLGNKLQGTKEHTFCAVRGGNYNNKLLQIHVLFVFIVVLLIAAKSCALCRYIMKKS